MAVIGALRGVLSLDSAAFEAGAKRAQASMSQLQRTLTARGEQMQRIGRRLTAGLTAPVAAAGVASVAAARQLGELSNQARVAGVGVQRFKELSLASARFGVQQDKLADVLKDTNDKFGDYLQTGGGPLADFFEKIAPKVNLTRKAFEGLSSDQALQKYVTALRDANVSQAEMTFYLEALASDATLLLPVFDENGKAIDAMAARARELGLALDEGVIARSQKAAADIGVISDVIKTRFQAAAADLLPVFADLAERTIPVIERVVEGVQSLADWFQSLTPEAQRFAGVAVTLGAALGPVAVGLGLMVVAIAPLVTPIGLVVAGLAGLGAAAVYVATRWSDLRERLVAFGSDIAARAREMGAAFADLGQQWGASLIEAKLAIGETASALWASFRSTGQRIVEEFVAAFLELPQRLAGIAAEAWAAFTSGFETAAAGPTAEAEDIGARFAESYAIGIDGNSDRVTLAAREVGRRAVEAGLVSARADAPEIGAALVAGMVRGLEGGAAQLYAKAQEIADGVAARVRKVLQIQSPSRVMAEIGGFAGEGLAKGLAEKAQEVADAAESLANSAVAGLGTLVDDFGSVIGDGLFDSVEATFDRLEDRFKGFLSSISSVALSNPIKISLGLAEAGTGGLGDPTKSGFAGALGRATTSGIGGLFSIGKNVAAAGGGFGAVLGAVLPPVAAVAGLLSSFYKKPTTELLGSGYYLRQDGLADGANLGSASDIARALNLEAFGYEYTKTTGGFFGSANDYDREFSDAGEAGDALAAQFRDLTQATLESAEILGISIDRFEDYFAFLGDGARDLKFKLKDLSDEQAAAEVLRVMNIRLSEMIAFGSGLDRDLSGAIASADSAATDLVATLQSLAREGEEISETMVRLATGLVAVADAVDLTNRSTLGAGFAAADIADKVATAFGGLDTLAASVTDYVGRFFTAGEQTQIIVDRLTQALEPLGAALPKTREGFRALVEGADLTTDSGRALYATLIQSAAAFDEILPRVVELGDALQSAVGFAQDATAEAAQAAAGFARDFDRSASLWFRTAETLRDVIADLRGTDLGGRSGAQQLAANRAAFQAATDAARAGDQSAAAAIPDLARSFLASAQDQARTATEFRTVAAGVQNQVELLAGIATLEGANDQVIASLYQRQIEVLDNLSSVLQLEGLTGEDVAAFGSEVQSLLQDFDGTVAGMRSDLAGLERAISEARDFSFAQIEDQLQVTLDIIPSLEGVPPRLREALTEEASAIRQRFSFILRRNDLSPDLVYLAANEVSEASRALNVAVTETGLTPGLRALAVADLTQTREFLASVDWAEGTPLGLRALTTATELSRTLGVTLSADLGSAETRLLLEQRGDYIANVGLVYASDSVTDRLKTVLLDAADAGLRAATVNVAFGDALLTAEERAVLTQTKTRARRIVRAVVRGVGDLSEAELRFLADPAKASAPIVQVLSADVAVTDPERFDLLGRIVAAEGGTITIGGGVAFDPSAAFASALEDGIAGPADALTRALDGLRGSIEGERLAREAAIRAQEIAQEASSVSSQIAELEAQQSDVLGQVQSTFEEIRALERQTGARVLRDGTLGADGQFDGQDRAIYRISKSGEIIIRAKDLFGTEGQLQAFKPAFSELEKRILGQNYSGGGLEGQALQIGTELEALRVRLADLREAGAEAEAVGGSSMEADIAGMREEQSQYGSRQVHILEELRALMLKIDREGLLTR